MAGGLQCAVFLVGRKYVVDFIHERAGRADHSVSSPDSLIYLREKSFFRVLPALAGLYLLDYLCLSFLGSLGQLL